MTIVTVALCLPGSVAHLRLAASAATALVGAEHGSTSSPQVALPFPRVDVTARVLYGPRRHNIRTSALKTLGTQTQATEPQTAAVPPQSHLQAMIDQSGVSARQRPMVASVLGLLEAPCQEKLETLSILYGNPKHRGLAGRGVILVSGEVPDAEFIGLLLHEGLGHFRDITCLTGKETAGESEFRDGDDPVFNDDPSVAFYRISWMNETKRKPTARRKDFVTGYAFEADNFEDLAESVTYYMTQEETFRKRAKDNVALSAKLRWLETYMPKQSAVAEGSRWDGKIAWDATKLGFTWMGN